MGKGSPAPAPQPSTITQNTSSIPEYARPYFEDIMNRGQAVSQVQYQPYTGDRVAEFSPLQNQAFQGIQTLSPSPLVGTGAAVTGTAGLGGLAAGQQYQQQATSPGAMQAYMSPYMQNVVNWQKGQAIQDYGRQLPGMQANATRAGAFGGSRQAIVESEAQRNLQNQLAGIQAQGTQSAFDQAQKSLQFGTQAGLQGLDLAGRMGGQLGQLGQTQFGQQLGAAQAQQQAGAIQQAQNQQQKDVAYEEFMRQQLYPQSQLQFLSSLLRGSVVAPQQTMYSYQQQPSMASQLGGLGIGALGLSKAFAAKDGGEIKAYAAGGVTGDEAGGLASNVAKLVKFLMASQNPEQDAEQLSGLPIEKYLALQKVRQLRGSMQNQEFLKAGTPQTTVMDDLEAGVAGLDVPEEGFAGGGIVAFANGGESDEDLTQEERDRRMLRGIGENFGRAGRKLGAAALDVGSAIPRGLAGAANTLIRLPRAAGLPVPFIPVDTSSLTPNYDAIRREEAGIPTALPQSSRVPSTQGEPEPTVYARPVTQQATTSTSPTAAATGATRRAAQATTAKPAAQEESDILKGLRDELKGLETPEAAEEAARKRMRSALPDDLKERLEGFKEQAAQAVKDRDQDRWLAVAMGGFAAAAGTSPYALKNLGEGLGLTSKELMNVNKDFRKAEQERKKLETEEKRLARAEALGIEKEAQAARERAIARRDAYNKAIINGELKLKEIAEKRFETTTRAASDAARTSAIVGSARDRSDPLRAEYVAAIQSKDPVRIKAAEEALLRYTRATQPQRFEKPEDPLIAALTGGAGGGVKLTPDQQKLLDKYK